jgi:hypothetical protein
MRETRYKLNALRNGAFLAELLFSPDDAPNIKFAADGEIKGSFSGAIIPDERFDLLRDELQPMIFTGTGWKSLGIFRPTTPTLQGSTTGERQQITAYDRGWILKNDRIESRLFIAAGTNYITAAEQQLAAANIARTRIIPNASTLPADREFEPGTTRLDIINTLMGEIVYRDVWFDGDGLAHLEPYAAPAVERIKHRYSSRNILREPMAPDYSAGTDIFSAPNVFICTCANADRSATLTATAVNDSPVSSKSTIRRGMRICQQVKVNEIADQAALDAYAKRLVTESQLSTQTVEFSTLAEAGHGVGDIIAIDHPTIGGIYEETGWSLTLRAGELMKHTAKRTVL